MPTSPLTTQQLRTISQAIEQTMTQLQSMEAGTDLQPMHYNARLCWEQLYEARELLRAHLLTQSQGENLPSHFNGLSEHRLD